MYCDMLVKFWNNIHLQNNIGIGKSLVEFPDINIASSLKTSSVTKKITRKRVKFPLRIQSVADLKALINFIN